MKEIKTVLRTLLSVLTFLLILESIFAIHEYGHLKEFQTRNIPVKEFSLGIGPTIYQHQASSFVVSIRLIPIMAYVAPTDEGGKILDKKSLREKIAIYVAGVKNNFLMGLIIVFVIQILARMRGNLSTRELIKILLITPFKLLLLFLSFLIGCVTWGRVDLTERFLLSTGGINPPKQISRLIRWNLILAILNFAPIPPLDGGLITQAILATAGNNIHITLDMPDLVRKSITIILFAAFYATASKQNMHVLEVESEKSKGTLFLSTRVKNLLLNSGISTVGELREYTAKQLLQIKGFGPESLKEVETFLLRLNLSLKPGKQIRSNRSRFHFK